jgi:hypothetical protein
MLKKARLILPVLLVAGAVIIPSGSSTADSNVFGTCPDGYTPTPFLAGPEQDRNGNGVVCVKFVGSHENTHDDPNGQKYQCNGFPTVPAECVTDPLGAFFIGDDII